MAKSKSKAQLSKIGKRSVLKCKRGEREAAYYLRQFFGCEAHRGRQYQGGADSPDVKHSIAGVHIEVKRCEHLNLKAALEQARQDAGGDNAALVLHRKNKGNWIAICELWELPNIVTQLYLTMAEHN